MTSSTMLHHNNVVAV